MSSITVEQYSEKAIVVRGNTIPYKEKLLSVGGKWNKMLKGGEGWIFPLTKKPIIEKLLSEPPTVYEDNSDSSSSSSSSYKSKQSTYKTSRSVSSESSSEVVLSKKEYLHLISRIERLEQLVAKFCDNDSSNESNDNNKELKKITKKQKKSNLPPPLSSISDADLCESVNYDDLECNSDIEREPVQRLLRKKNNL